jgi:hypothetical protein
MTGSTVVIDFETRSRINLTKAGAWRYAADPSTDVRCIAYAIDDDPVELWLPGNKVPAAILEAAADSDCLFVAHNAQFERAVSKLILEPHYGWLEIPVERWRCTMAAALALALPAKLAKIAEVLELENQKADDGIMHQMSKPRPPRKGEDPAGVYWFDDAERLQKLYAYCKQDVACERELACWLPPLSDAEQALWCLDQRINDRGFYSDGALIEKAIGITKAAVATVKDQLNKITGGEIETGYQTARMQAFLAARGCELEDLQKDTLSQALRRVDLGDEVRRIIELRLEAAHAAAGKMPALKAWRAVDGRARGTFRYHGAATGRWSGSGPQPQNFRRESEGTAEKVAAVMTGDLESVRLLGAPIEVVGDVARASICAPPGFRLLIGDFSGIESRGLAWIADERSKLEQWAKFDRTGAPEDDPYFIGGRSLGFPQDVARKFGKTADLAFGYQGGAGAYKNFAPKDDTASEAQIQGFKLAWRRRHPQIEQFWRGIDRAAIAAVNRAPEVIRYGRLTLQVKTLDDASFLLITLPSGRRLSYPFPKVIIAGRYSQPAVAFMDNAQGRWIPCRGGEGAYGGTWTENIVSGIARDLLSAAMQRLEAAGYRIVLHVHDEIVCELEDGIGSLEEFKALIEQLPDWAEGLPVAAKVRNGPRFAEAELAVTHVPGSMQPPPMKLRAKRAGLPGELEEDDLEEDDSEELEPPEELDPGELEPGPKKPKSKKPKSKKSKKPERAEPADPPPGGGPEPAEPDDDDGDSDLEPGDEPPRNDYPRGERPTGRQIAFYVYRDARGHNYLGVKRTFTKQFPQYRWEGRRWLKGLPKGFLKIPYRLPELLDAPPDDWVVIAAGEKDAETAARLGFVATTNSGGEGPGQWTPELARWFSGFKRVAVMEDNDDAGYAHALEVAKALDGIVPDIRIVGFRELEAGGDLTDWVKAGAGRGKAELLVLIKAAPGNAELNEWDAGELLSGALPEPRQWLIIGQFCRTFLSGLVAPGEVGKTTLRLTQAIELAIGRELLGMRIFGRRRVLVLSFEDDRTELHRRILAICKHHGIDPKELKGWLFCRDLNGGARLAELDAKGKRRQIGRLDGQIRRAIARTRCDLVILDPFVKLHALNESDNADMNFVCELLIKIAQDLNIAVDSPAHTHKGVIQAGDADARRGASAQRDAGRLDYTLTVMSEEEAEAFGIPADERKRHMRLDKAKANIVRAVKARWFRLASVRIDNATNEYPDGDEVQAIERWEPPETWEGVDEETRADILDAIEDGLPAGQRYSSASAAKGRAAWRVVQRRCPSKPEASCREIIRQWLKSGVLVEENYEDPVQRKSRSGLRVDRDLYPRRKADS